MNLNDYKKIIILQLSLIILPNFESYVSTIDQYKVAKLIKEKKFMIIINLKIMLKCYI